MLGLISCVGFDALFDTVSEADPRNALTGIVSIVEGGYVDEFLEAILSGAFLGANLLMLCLGFTQTSRSFFMKPVQKIDFDEE
ncbi:MAG: hypothetical protein RIC89_01650 [Pseudomonadales bacterium]